MFQDEIESLFTLRYLATVDGYLPQQQDFEFQSELTRDIASGFRALGSSTERNSVSIFMVQCEKKTNVILLVGTMLS